MAAACPSVNTLNQTNSNYNNVCLLGGSEAVLQNATVTKVFEGCCDQYQGRSNHNDCYHICMISNVTSFQLVPDCLREVNFAEGGGLAISCFGDLKDNALMELPPSGPPVSFNQSTATVSDSPASTGSSGATITSPPKPKNTSASATIAASATSTPASKASTSGSLSLGVAVIVGLAFFGLLL
jgi:hypothetical protein